MPDFRSTVACLLGPGLGLWLSLGLGTLSSTALATDVAISPPAGGGFSVTDASGNTPRLRVQESGAVSVPGLPSAAQQDTPQCFNSSTGTLGPCAPTTPPPSYSASNIEYSVKSLTCTADESANESLKDVVTYCRDTRYVVSGGCITNSINGHPYVAMSAPTQQGKGAPIGWLCRVKCYSDVQFLTASALCAP